MSQLTNIIILLMISICNTSIAPPSTNKHCYAECGLATEILIPSEVPSVRAYGGARIHPQTFPFVGFVQGQLLDCHLVTTCTAVIIGPNHLLTAAHCVQYSKSDHRDCKLTENEYEDEYSGYERFRPSDLSVFVGESSISRALKGKKIGVKRVRMMSFSRQIESPTDRPFIDLALLELKTTLEFNEKTRPICVPTTFEEKLGEQSHFIGFGRSIEGSGPPVVGDRLVKGDALNRLIVAFSSPAFCNMRNPRQKKDFICAGSPSTGLSHGDSGGPLVIHSGGRAFLVGIASFTEVLNGDKLTPASLRKDLHPDTFVRTSSYCSWIKKEANISCVPTNLPVPESCLKYAEQFYERQIGAESEEILENDATTTATKKTESPGYFASGVSWVKEKGAWIKEKIG